MPKLFNRKRNIGLPPGSFTTNAGDAKIKTRISYFDYNAEKFQERQMEKIEECFVLKNKPTISWINIEGKDVETIEKIDECYGIHPLVLEDILNTEQRPKIEDHDDYIFIVLKMIHYDRKLNDILSEQVSLVVGKGYVISFQETAEEGDVFDPIRTRIRENKGRVRKMGADYLAYALLDCIIDNYFVVIEQLGYKIEDLENRVISDASPNIPKEIHQLKSMMIYLRRQIWPLREVLNNLQRSESNLVTKETAVFLRDIYDHVIVVAETLEAFRDTLAGLHDIYLSSITNKMNEIMKVLTTLTTIFIPLTFISGIYGMNFEHMPELHWEHGYYFTLIFMAIIACVMVTIFKIKKWL